jgi:CRISPR system Cascade subunit CasD
MDFVLCRLYAPLASWGDIAVGEFRPSLGYPGRSSLLGLIAAALGVERADDDRHHQLADALAFAVAVYSEGTLLRDYHTAQVPSASDLKKRPHRTRADELSVPRDALNTILSTRDYRQDALCVFGTWLRAEAMNVDLPSIRCALERPRFALYLGRKACPPALPLSPQLIVADDFRTALGAASFPEVEELAPLNLPSQPLRVAWEAEDNVGWPQSFSVPRRDAPRSRRRWQFGDRTERVALIGAAAPAGESGEEEPA